MSRSLRKVQHFFSALRWRGLTLQLFLFVILPLAVLVVAVPLASLTLHARAMRTLVGERDERAARAAADALAEQLNHRAAAVQGLALDAASSASPELLLAGYDYLLPDFEGGLALMATDGVLLATSTLPDTWLDWPILELVTQVTDGSEPHFSETFTDPKSGELMMLVAATGPSGPVAVGAFLPASLAHRTLDHMTNGSAISAWIVDDGGQLLYQAGRLSPEADLTQHSGVAEALRGGSGTTYRQIEGNEHVVAFAPVPSPGWALVIEEPWEAVDSPLLRRTQMAPLVLVPLLLVALVALGFGIRQIVQPLQSLERKAAELGWGHFEAIEEPVGGTAEIRHLQAELIHMARKVQATQQNLRDYVSAITTGQEDERRRLARDLHDGTVQALIALNQRVQLAQLAGKNGPPELSGRLTEIRQMTAMLMEDIRRVIRALRPIYLEDLGLLPALEMLARDCGVPVTFASEGTVARLTPEREIAVYRIAQEALNNITHHAEATTVHVAVTFHQDEFVLRVQDNGRGFVVPARVSELVTAGHHGLMGMQERAELIGGKLAIQSAPDMGTTVELHLPL